MGHRKRLCVMSVDKAIEGEYLNKQMKLGEYIKKKGFRLSSLQFLRPFHHSFTIKIGEGYGSSLYFHQNQHSKTILTCISTFLAPLSTEKTRDLTDAFVKVLRMQSCTGKRPWRKCVGTTHRSPVLLLLSCIPETSGLGSIGLPRMAKKKGYCCGIDQLVLDWAFSGLFLVSLWGPKFCKWIWI
ncbi:hypothetical protein ES288_A03G180600v1 [Gossypium darwinii]|uniref:Uncharacterized protein n=1 Tax=Gossypium darwinii TaxID=34276 RepID=A0A5D2H5X8_GOSDA|nr:hypothetical protein ES288_A03G180600v1 [Gossypium darwinii]